MSNMQRIHKCPYIMKLEEALGAVQSPAEMRQFLIALFTPQEGAEREMVGKHGKCLWLARADARYETNFMMA